MVTSSILTASLAESTYVGYNMIVMMFGMGLIAVFMMTAGMLEQGKTKNAIRLVAGTVLVLGLVLSLAPLQTTATSELVAEEKPESYDINNFTYEYEHNGEIQIEATESNVEQIKIFATGENKPTDQAERLSSSPETTLDVPTSDTVVIITYDENGNIIEETEIEQEKTVNESPIL